MRIPPPILLVACVALIFLGQFYFPQFKLSFGVLQLVIAAFFLLAGLFVARIAGKQFAEANTTINPVKLENTSKLVTEGVFAYSRNPMYVGLISLLIAIVVFFGFWPGIVLVPALFLYVDLVQIAAEEKVLIEKFGQENLDYKTRVRRWL